MGEVVSHGNVAPLIELGAGFDADLSAVKIFLNGAILGYSREYMEENLKIVSFAELEEFIDVPIKYSSGMTARLGFG